MSIDGVDDLVDELRVHAGDSLRVVAEYDDDGYHVGFAREDVAPRIAERAEDVHGDLVLQGIGREHLEDLFEAGDLHCSVHRFDEVTAFHFLADEYSGLFVSIDGDADVPLASFAETCRDHL